MAKVLNTHEQADFERLAAFYPYRDEHGLTGFKSEIDNQDWIIAKAEHTIDNSGFTTQLELEAKIPEWIAETE
ncbi:TPA: hypothetical protein HIT55_000547 [Escherichia fergusonii]|nr:hypothetical protein [Escherichia fergusonii]